MKTSCSHGSNDYHTRFATVSILPEVENDRLENSPHPSGIPVLTTPAEVPPLSYIAEECGSSVTTASVDLCFGGGLKETNNNDSQQVMEFNTTIQTEI